MMFSQSVGLLLLAAILLCTSVWGIPSSDGAAFSRVPEEVQRRLELRAPGKAGLPAGSAANLDLSEAILEGAAQIPLLFFADGVPVAARSEGQVEFVADSFSAGDSLVLPKLPQVDRPSADFAPERVVIWQADVRLETDDFAAEHACAVVLSMNGAERVISFEERVGTEQQRKLLLGLVPGLFDVEHLQVVLVDDEATEEYGVGGAAPIQKRAFPLIDVHFSPSSGPPESSRLLVAGHSSDILALEKALLASFWPVRRQEEGTGTDAEIEIQLDGQTGAFLDFFRPSFMTDQQWFLVPQLWKNSLVKSGLIFGEPGAGSAEDEAVEFGPDSNVLELSNEKLEALFRSSGFRGLESLVPCSAPKYCLDSVETLPAQVVVPNSLSVSPANVWTLRWPVFSDRETLTQTVLSLAKRWRNPEFRFTLRPRMGKNIVNQVATIQSFLDLANTFVFLSQTAPPLPSSKQVDALLDQLAHGFLAMESKLQFPTGLLRTGPFRTQLISISQISGGVEFGFMISSSLADLLLSECLRWSPALREYMEDIGLGYDLKLLYDNAHSKPADDSYFAKFQNNNRLRSELQVAIKSQLLIVQNLHRILGSAEARAGMIAGPRAATQDDVRRKWLQHRNVHDCRNASECGLSQRATDYWNWKFEARAMKKICPNLQQNLHERLNTCLAQLVASPRVELRASQLMNYISLFCSSTVLQQELSSSPPVDSEAWSNLCEDLSLSFHVYANWRAPDFHARQACNKEKAECFPIAWTNVKQALQRLLYKQPQHFWSLFLEAV